MLIVFATAPTGPYKAYDIIGIASQIVDQDGNREDPQRAETFPDSSLTGALGVTDLTKVSDITLPDDQTVLINYTRYRVSAGLLGVEKKDYFVLSTDAADDNPPDGYPDIPADSVSSCKIRIRKKNGETGLDMTAPEDNDLMELRTQRGRLSAWQVSLVNGYAEVTLTSSAGTVITEVTVYDVAGQLGKQAIYIQFA
ncbi:MAG: hypothetical protein Fur0037_19100 [Planctomycetota bacterium]